MFIPAIGAAALVTLAALGWVYFAAPGATAAARAASQATAIVHEETLAPITPDVVLVNAGPATRRTSGQSSTTNELQSTAATSKATPAQTKKSSPSPVAKPHAHPRAPQAPQATATETVPQVPIGFRDMPY